MSDPTSNYILVHDVGTTGNKACLYRFDETLELVDSYVVEYRFISCPTGALSRKWMSGGRPSRSLPTRC